MLDNVYQVHESRIAKAAFMCFFIASIGLILYCRISFVFIIIMVLFLTAASFAPYQQVFHRKRLVFQFVRDNAWLITENQGQPEKGELLRDTIVTPYFVLLRFRCVSRIKSYLVMRDSLIDSNLNTLILQLKLTTF